MNTADRSIALLDTALRRRFGFVELLPDVALLENTMVNGIPLGRWLASLNQRICEHVGRDARNLQVGHAYFLDDGKPVSSFGRLSRILREDVIPLLQEYCYEDFTALERILGEGLVDRHSQQIKHHLFDESRQHELVQALLAPDPEIVTTVQATVAEVEPLEDEDEASAEDADDGADGDEGEQA
jgi:5-methylcytosine-specific restriction protein B